jgi:hypothetical protein
MSKRNRVLATEALANKLTKATYYIMRVNRHLILTHHRRPILTQL